MNLDKNKAEIAQLIKEEFPHIDWNKFEEIDKALNTELWHGPMPSAYWTDADPLEHYTWNGYVQAEIDLRDLLDDLPSEVFLDRDFDEILLENPEDNPDNWEEDPDNEDEQVYIGPWEYIQFDPRKVLMFSETYKQVYP